MALPTYGRPGVFVTESLTPLSSVISAPGDSLAAFIGANPQGPTTPTLVSSWGKYTQLFGGFSTATNYLPYSVYMYFANGGRACYVCRTVGTGATAATVTLQDRNVSPVNTLKFTAVSAGAWGNSLYVDITDNAVGGGYFDLTIKLGGTTNSNIVERWTDVTMNPSDSRFVVSLLNSTSKGSLYVAATALKSSTFAVNDTPSVQSGTQFGTGADGATPANSDYITSISSFDIISGNLVFNLPGITTSTVINALINYCDPALGGRGDCFAVVEVSSGQTANQSATQAQGYTPSSYAAVYGPWLQVNDPSTSVSGISRMLPPGGAVLGQYAVTDATRGVQKPPAGINTLIKNVLGIETTFSGTDLDTLNAAGVNIIRPLPGTGIAIFGARTLKTAYPDRYVSVRRTLIYIKSALIAGTRYAVFEPNNPTLWTDLTQNVTQFLTTLMQQGILSGNTTDQAFYVVCDASNNPPSAVQQGVVNISVGVALSSPAEFIIINIGQFNGSVTATDTTTGGQS